MVFVYLGLVLIGEVILFIFMFFGSIIGSWFVGIGMDLLFFRFSIGIGEF